MEDQFKICKLEFLFEEELFQECNEDEKVFLVGKRGYNEGNNGIYLKFELNEELFQYISQNAVSLHVHYEE